MNKRKLGINGPEVSSLGLGCMGMSWAYGPTDEAESLRVLSRARELGMTFWDTAEAYGPYLNEELLGKSLKTVPREEIFLATKFLNTSADGSGHKLSADKNFIRKSLEGSLKRLGVDHVDLYYQHRLDRSTPVEESVRQMSELVKEGKVRYIGLSEVSGATIRKAHSVHPITAVQSEYSLWERGVEKSVLPTIKDLGIGFVPYSPMGRGFLTGTIKNQNDFAAGDGRLGHPRFQGENLKQNLALVEQIQTIAKHNRVTPAQLALAWILRQGPHIVPIPGTKRIKYLEENAKSVSVEIDSESWTKIDQVLATFKSHGDRYSEAMMNAIDDEPQTNVTS